MKKRTVILFSFLTLQSLLSFSNHIKEPIKDIQLIDCQLINDNPKGKLKLRFVSTTDKSDTTNKPKTFFAKIRNVFNSILDISENPPFRIEIVREKEKKN